MRHFVKHLINAIYPNVCGICGEICDDDVCIKCKVKINEYKECKKHIYLSKNFSTHMYLFRYEDLVREKIIQYKFSDKAYIGKSFVNFIINNKKICGFLKKYDIIIPVPISKNRKNKRGYNQSELIAKELRQKIEDIHIVTNVLYKIKNTVPQSSLTREQRNYNLQNAYIVKNSGIIKNKKILLLDDIYTTGNTVDECGKMLKLAGAHEIGVLTLAKD